MLEVSIVVILIKTIYDSLDNIELLRAIAEASLCDELSKHIDNDPIDVQDDKLKNLNISEYTEPGGSGDDVVCEAILTIWLKEMTLMLEFLDDDEGCAIGGNESKLGGMEEAES